MWKWLACSQTKPAEIDIDRKSNTIGHMHRCHSPCIVSAHSAQNFIYALIFWFHEDG